MAEGGRIQPQEPSAEMYPLPGDDVDSLRQQIQQLQFSLANMTQPVTPRIVLPPPVKLPTYSGIDDPDMWIERATLDSFKSAINWRGSCVIFEGLFS